MKLPTITAVKRPRLKRYAHYRVEKVYDGSWRWVLIVSTRILAKSSTVFATRRKALDNVRMVKKYAGTAEITEEP